MMPRQGQPEYALFIALDFRNLSLSRHTLYYLQACSPYVIYFLYCFILVEGMMPHDLILESTGWMDR